MFFWTNGNSALRWSADLERVTSTFASKPQTNVVMFFLIICIVSVILKIFIILQAFDLPLPIVKKKATKGRNSVFFFSFWYFFPLCWPLCLAIVTLFVVATLSAWWHQRQWQRCSHLKDSQSHWYLVHWSNFSNSKKLTTKKKLCKHLLQSKWAHGYWKVMAKQNSRLAIKAIFKYY